MKKCRNFWTKELAVKKASEFTNKRDFKKKYIAAYELLRKNDWLNDACLHMNRPIKWTFDECKRVALKYNKKIEFKKNHGWAYNIAKQMGWLDEITSHMAKNKIKKNVYWTKERCHIDALKYTTRNLFAKKSPKAYSACARNKWLDEICTHMKKPYESQIKWTKNKCQIIAQKFTSRKEFFSANKLAYSAARYNGWLNEICIHMVCKKQPNRYWYNIENCKNEALKYKTKTDFIKNSEHVYNVSLKKGWLDEICGHMILAGDRKHKCVYSYEFSDNHVYIGLTYNIEVREKSRKYCKNDAVTIYKNKTNIVPIRKQLTDYIDVDEASKLEGKYLEEYISKGWISLNRAKTGGIGGSSNVWNYNRIKKIAIKYKTIEELKENDIFIFNIIEKEQWIDSIYKK